MRRTWPAEQDAGSIPKCLSPRPTSKCFPVIRICFFGGDEIPNLELQTVAVRLRELSVINH
jgi:hypothetical protein